MKSRKSLAVACRQWRNYDVVALTLKKSDKDVLRQLLADVAERLDADDAAVKQLLDGVLETDG